MTITVGKPAISLREPFLRMLDDYEAHDPENGAFYASARADFDAYVGSLHDEEAGIDLVPGFVLCSHRWLLDEVGTLIGIVRVRHNIDTPFLSQEAGHIGYDVPPSQRGRGYGIASLQAGLTRAQELKLERVLICADAGNPASWRTIERCGGVLEREFRSEHYHCLVRRYWIEIP